MRPTLPAGSSVRNKTIGGCTFRPPVCLPLPGPVRADIWGCVHCSLDSRNNTCCLCMRCKALLFPRSLHFHGNQTGRKEKDKCVKSLSAWKQSGMQTKGLICIQPVKTSHRPDPELLEENLLPAGFGP